MADGQSLYEQLSEYGQSDYYPFHMPGHKRNADVSYLPAMIDITEIDGFDNLHHAKDVLKSAMERAASLYGSGRSFFLINGSTCGLLAAISAVAKNQPGTIIMARNCHKAAYHAAFLNRLDVEYVYPQVYDENGVTLQGSIAPQDVELLLQQNQDVRAVVLTSPTYDGVVSNIEKIAEVAHACQVPLIVDEAHGAHLGFHEAFPQSAVKLGADIVIQSLHKTLPSMTQTALLHVNGNLINERLIEKYTAIYQTSSPSYVMMAGMDSCIRLLEEMGLEYFSRYTSMLNRFAEEIEGKGLHNKGLKHLKVAIFKEEMTEGAYGKKNFTEVLFDKDPSKILIFTGNSGKSGKWLYEKLLQNYHLQMEMAAGNYVLAMTSIMDREEGFKRLIDALYEIDESISREKTQAAGIEENTLNQKTLRSDDRKAVTAPRPKTVCRIDEAEASYGKRVAISKSSGCVSKEYVYLYPPGSPILVPGEEIDDIIIEVINHYKEMAFSIEGLQDENAEWIEVVKG